MVKPKKGKAAAPKKKAALKPKKAAPKPARPKAAAKLKLKAVRKVLKKAPPKQKPAPAAQKQVSPKIVPYKIETPAARPAPPEVKKETPKPIIKEQIKEVLPVKKEIPALKPVPQYEPVKIEPKVEVKAAAPVEPVKLKELELDLPITVKDLAIKLQEKPSAIIKFLMDTGIMAGINQSLDEQNVIKICEKYGCKINKALGKEEVFLKIHEEQDEPKDLHPRPAVVTIMGHVDHGKTSLLDAIRKTKVAESEHGGITQHIGAYRVSLEHGEITFLDTPGHEAFTAMRARGARITDIVILVVAADDGIMPQTQEAIDHARAAGVPIIVAINKIDKPQAELDRVKKQLADLDLKAEDWGGKTITVPVSAKTGEGIDSLLEMMLLEAQMLELKSNPNRPARGVVVEAKMAKGRGPVATLLVQNGTLRLNENIIVGNFYGKIRAMTDDHGRAVISAGPGVPVEALGVSNVPEAGEQFFVIPDEKQAKELAAMRSERERLQQIKTIKRISLEDLHAEIAAGKLKELKLIIKADVQGSLEAIKETLSRLNVSEIKLESIHTGVGSINSSDVILAVASNALILGFNVTADEPAKQLLAKEGVDARTYNIIYELANDIKAAVEGMLEPKIKKVFVGRAEVRKVFKLSRAGTVAGCFITKGKLNRSSLIDIVRNGDLVFEGKISALKRFKDDVRDVAEGFECGISFSGFDAMMEGDIIEAYEIEKIARKL